MAVILNTNKAHEAKLEKDETGIELKLGPNKIIHILPWKAKAKKEFVKIFKEKKDKTSEKDILNILVYPYLEEKDLFYSSAEIQYVTYRHLQTNETREQLECRLLRERKRCNN